MIKRFLFAFCLAFCVCLSLSPSLIDAKYTESQYHLHPEDNSWDTTNASAPAGFNLYAYVQQQYCFPKSKIPFEFNCLQGEFSTDQTEAMMSNQLQFKNNALDTFDGGRIFQFTIPVEAGTYQFVSLNKTHPLFLDLSGSDMDTHLSELDLQAKNTVAIQAGETDKTRVFTMIGDYEWCKKNWKTFQKWAQEREHLVQQNASGKVVLTEPTATPQTTKKMFEAVKTIPVDNTVETLKNIIPKAAIVISICILLFGFLKKLRS